MTDLKERPTHASAESPWRAHRVKIIAGLAVVGVALLAIGAYWFVFRDTSAASVDSDAAAEARAATLEEAAATSDSEPTEDPADDPVAAEDPADDPVAAEDPADDPAAQTDPAPETETEASPDPAPVGVDGTWTVDTSIGTFDDACLTEVCGATFVGFRIDEELASIGAKTVVGRTPGVSGTIEIEGTTITAADILVDMTGLITDDPSRTNAIRRQAIETDAFPEASFVLTEPADFGVVPAAGEQVSVDVTGDLTIHGVTRTETIPLTAELSGDIIVVFGTLGPILLEDYGIDKPRAAVVLSVEDNALMELQLFLTR